MIIVRYFKRIMDVIDKKYRKKVCMVLMTQCILTIITILSTLLYTYYINNIIYNKKIDQMQYVVLGFLLILFVEILLTGIYKIAGCKLFDTILIGLRIKLWNSITHIPQSEIEERGVGDMKLLIDEDVSFIESFLTSKFDYFINIVKILVYTIIMLRINAVLTLFGIVTIPIYILITKYLAKKTSQVEEQNREINRKYNRWLDNDYKGWRDVKTLCCEEMQEEKFDGYWEQIFHSFNWIFVYNFLNRSMVTVKNFFILYVATYALAGYMVISGKIDVITLILFVQYFTLFMNSYDANSNMKINTGKERIHIDKVIEQIKRTFVTGRSIGEIHEIDVKQVDFSYAKSQQVILKNINLSFPVIPSNTAIVGSSGCGKSTLLKLLLGLYNADNGTVSVNGHPINSYLPQEIYGQIGGILQDSQLFPMSIRDNLKMGNDKISEEEMKKICECVHIREFIESLPEQYDTIISQDSTNISGGQKQRLLYARLIIQDPKVIILDESTSMLDAEGSRLIKQNLSGLWKEKTIIQVSHKLDDIKDADRIILLNDGEVIDEGKHDVLYANNDVYRSMFQEQVINV